MAEKPENIYSKLVKLQAELKAPKNQFNKFGGYSYRSLEDIWEGVKPLLVKYGLACWLRDDIELIDGRYYVRAIATLINVDNPSERIEVSSLARESENKKGMDTAQVTGSTSSYARKYALNGLFAIDDTKDPDTQDNSGQGKKKQGNTRQTAKKAESGSGDKFKIFIKRYYAQMNSKFGKTNEEITTLVEQLLGQPARQAEEKDVAEAVKKIYLMLQKEQADKAKQEKDPENIEMVQAVLDGVFPTRVH